MATRPLPKTQRARPHLRVIGGSAARRRVSVGAVVLLVLTVFAVASLQAYLAQEGLRVASLEKTVRLQEEQTTLLQARQAQLANPGRIADEASKLGLVGDPQPTFLRAPDAPKDDTASPAHLDALHKLLAPSSP
jgi:hypothetical protein